MDRTQKIEMIKELGRCHLFLSGFQEDLGMVLGSNVETPSMMEILESYERSVAKSIDIDFTELVEYLHESDGCTSSYCITLFSCATFQIDSISDFLDFEERKKRGACSN